MWPWRRNKNPSEAVLPDEQLLASCFISPLFKQRVREVAGHTSTGFEGGFAAYRRKGALVLSQAILPEPQWWVFTHWRKDWDPRLVFPEHMLCRQFHPVGKPRDPEEEWILRQDPDRSQRLRRDMFLFLHSHPSGNAAASRPDMGCWSATESSSPRTTYAVLACKNGLTKIMLWRRQSDAPHYQPMECDYSGYDLEEDMYQKSYREHMVRNEDDFLGYCEKLGLNALVATYNQDRNRLYPNATAIAERLAA